MKSGLQRLSFVVLMVALFSCFAYLSTLNAKNKADTPVVRMLGQLGYGTIRNAAWQPSGELFAVGSSQGVRLYAADFQEIAYLDQQSSLSLSWSANGRYLASAHPDGEVFIWNISTFEVERRFQAQADMGEVYSLAWSPDDSRLASGGRLGVSIWNVHSGRRMQSFKFNELFPVRLAWKPNGLLLAVARDETLEIRNPESGSVVLTLTQTGRPLVIWSPDGEQLVTAVGDPSLIHKSANSVRVWDANKGTLLTAIQAGLVNTLAWSPDGLAIATSSSENAEEANYYLSFWDPQTGELIRRLENPHNRIIHSISWRSDNSLLLTASDDNTVKVWEWPLESNLIGTVLEGYMNSVTSLDWDASGGQLVSASQDGYGRLWDAASYTPLSMFEGNRREVWSVSWDPLGAQVATGGADYQVRVWDVNTGNIAKPYKHDPLVLGGVPGVTAVAFNQNGDIASGGSDGFVRIWSGGELTALTTDRGQVASLDWSAEDGVLIAGDGRFEIWDAIPDNQYTTLECGEGSPIYQVAASPVGSKVAGANVDGQICIWDVLTKQLLTTLNSQGESLTWNPDGVRLAAIVRDYNTDAKAIQVWDTTTSETLVTITDQPDVTAIDWSPDGMRLAAGGEDGIIRIWEMR